MNACGGSGRAHWSWAWVFWLSSWALLACQPSPAQAPDDLDTPLPKSEQAPAGSQGERTAAAGKAFLWRASSPTATVFLLGSIHVARKDLYPLAPPIEK